MLDMQLTPDDANHMTLVMTYTIRGQIKQPLSAGSGAISRAIEHAARYLAGAVNVDPHSVRFTITDDREAERDGCSVDVRN